MGGIYPSSNKFVSELLHVVFIEKSVSSFSVVNKIGSTTVRLQCGEGDATLISQQLSHSIHTQARHYEGIVGSSPCRECLSHKGGIAWEKDEQKSSELHQSEQISENEQLQKRKKWVKFTAKEEEEIRGYFATKLAAKTTTTLFSWQEFLRDHPYTIGTRNKSRTRLRTWLSSHKLS